MLLTFQPVTKINCACKLLMLSVESNSNGIFKVYTGDMKYNK